MIESMDSVTSVTYFPPANRCVDEIFTKSIIKGSWEVFLINKKQKKIFDNSEESSYPVSKLLKNETFTKCMLGLES